MKASVETTTPEKVFVPFTLHIEVESVDEARSLWHQLDVAWPVIKKHANGRDCIIPQSKLPDNTWNVLDDHMDAHNLKGL